jgi:hypothetical protein
MRIGREQDQALDRPQARFRQKLDILHNLKKAVEGGVTEIDHLRRSGIENRVVEQCHLIGDLSEIGGFGHTWKIVLQSVTGRIDVEHPRIGTIEAQVIDEKPSQKRLAALRARRSYDEERRRTLLGPR